MLQLVYSNESRLDHYIENFVRALDNSDEGGKESALISTITTAINQGTSADEVITAFSAYGIGNKHFRKSIANRFILAEAI